MFLNQWSIALNLVNVLTLLLVFLAVRTAVRVLLFWDVSSDRNLQIQLENETWLASTLVEYASGFQIISLVLFALAADGFSEVVIGAMCATGALTANSYGLPTLYLKLFAVFLYGFWIVLHHIDISSEQYPLLKAKYVYLVILIPVLIADIALQNLYIAGLKPDIITSCCAVVFGEGSSSDMNLIGVLAGEKMMLPVFYGLSIMLAGMSLALVKKWSVGLSWICAFSWGLYFILSLIVVTTIFSSYIYAMPNHRCPFCVLKPEYDYIGFLIFGALISSVFFGATQGLVNMYSNKKAVKEAVRKYQLFAVKISIGLMAAFVLISSYHFVMYRLTGGEM
jgi:hypothetical protein